jgi:hypothetical protein
MGEKKREWNDLHRQVRMGKEVEACSSVDPCKSTIAKNAVDDRRLGKGSWVSGCACGY